MTPDVHLNRPLGSPLALHKQQVGPLDTLTEAFDFRVSMAEIERLSKCIEWTDLLFVER